MNAEPFDLAGLLWGRAADATLVPRSDADPTRRTVGRFSARPGLDHMTTLVPRGRAAAGQLRRISAQYGTRDRLTRLAAVPAAHVGAMSLLRGTDVVLQVDATTDPSSALVATIAERLGVGPLGMVVYMGPARPNRKPVLQLTDRRNRPVAWAKVAPNDLTRRLLSTERDSLVHAWTAATSAAAAPTLRTPRVVDTFDWHGAEVLVTEPLPISWRRVRADRAELVDLAARDITELGDRRTIPMYGSSWSERTRERLSGAGESDIASVLEELAPALPAVAFGAWHGDFTSWNHDVVGRRVTVWDWERFDPDVPVGLDLVHLVFQEIVQRTEASVAAAFEQTVERLDPARLVALGAEPDSAGTVALLYLVELLARYAEDRSLATNDRYERWCRELGATIASAAADLRVESTEPSRAPGH